MSSSPLFLLLLIVLCLVTQGFFAMVEMAAVSFNKVRLQYYVSQHHRRAKWLSFLLQHPILLFGTTLIGVNAALVVGSECARRFYSSLGYSPDWAPLSQVLLVLIFAELAPMFAGRRYAEYVAMRGAPVLFFFSLLFRPLIWALDFLCRLLARLVGKPLSSGAYLSREELQNMISEKEEMTSSTASSRKFNAMVSNIFSLKTKRAKDLMQPLSQVTKAPSFCTVEEMRTLVREKQIAFLPIYHRDPQHIVAVAYPRDLLRLSDHKRVTEKARPPWFITEQTPILHLIKQFRRNNQSLAIVLNEKGVAVGIVTLDEIVDEIFGRSDEWNAFDEVVPKAYQVVLDRSFEGQMRLDELNKQFHVHLSYRDAETLEELMVKALGHTPSQGESIRVDQFELIAEEVSLLGVKMVQVRTIF